MKIKMLCDKALSPNGFSIIMAKRDQVIEIGDLAGGGAVASGYAVEIKENEDAK